MKKQLILLLVASAASNIDAAATGRFGSAARGALASGGQTFTSALPSGVSNIAKRAATFRTSAPKFQVTQPMQQPTVVQQFARPTYFGQFKHWFNNLFANRSALVTGTAALGGAATYGWLKSQQAALAEEEKIAEELKSRINEFKPFSYQRVFVNDASKCPRDKDTCTKDDLTYEIKAVETPEDIRLYLKNPQLIFDIPIYDQTSEFVTDSEGKNLILINYWHGKLSETRLQLPERLLPGTKIKYIRISDNEIELILPRNPGQMPAWWYAQTINVFNPQSTTSPDKIYHIKAD